MWPNNNKVGAWGQSVEMLKSILLCFAFVAVISWQAASPVYVVRNAYQGILGLPNDLRIRICQSSLIQAIDFPRFVQPLLFSAWISLAISFYLGDWDSVGRSVGGILLGSVAMMMLVECDRLQEIFGDHPSVRNMMLNFYVVRRMI